jgi:hypothetical protein
MVDTEDVHVYVAETLFVVPDWEQTAEILTFSVENVYPVTLEDGRLLTPPDIAVTVTVYPVVS